MLLPAGADGRQRQVLELIASGLLPPVHLLLVSFAPDRETLIREALCQRFTLLSHVRLDLVHPTLERGSLGRVDVRAELVDRRALVLKLRRRLEVPPRVLRPEVLPAVRVERERLRRVDPLRSGSF